MYSCRRIVKDYQGGSLSGKYPRVIRSLLVSVKISIESATMRLKE